MRSEQTRIYLSLVALQMVTMVLMLIITAFAFSDSRQRQTIQGQSTLALTAIELGARSELTTEEILHALSGRDYRLETAHEDAVTQEMAAQALEGRVVYDEAACTRGFFRAGAHAKAHQRTDAQAHAGF